MSLSLWKGEIEPPPRMARIAQEIADRHGLTMADMNGDDRSRSVAWARQEAMAAIYATGRFSMPQIGRFFGWRDHTTVLHAIRQVAKRRAA